MRKVLSIGLLKRLLNGGSQSLTGRTATLVFSTIVGQSLFLLALPLLTRLYDPSAFGLLGIMSSVLMTLTVVICLRMDMAIPIPDNDEDALAIAVVAVLSLVSLVGLTGALLWLFGESLSGTVLPASLMQYHWMIPIGLLLGGSFSIAQYWTIRRKRIDIVARSQITRAFGGAGSQVAFGAAGFSAGGLLWGHLIYIGSGALSMIVAFIKNDRQLWSTLSIKKIKKIAIEYKKFPMYSVPEALLDAGMVYLPLLVIGYIVGVKEAGLLMLAQRVVGLPVGVVSGNLARVYLSEAAERRRSGEIRKVTLDLLRRVFLFGLLPFVGLAIAAPYVFPVLFGADWFRAGVMVSYLVPATFLQFVVVPVAPVLHILDRHIEIFKLKLFGFVSTLGSMCVIGMIDSNSVFAIYAVVSLVFYVVYIAVVVRAANTGV